MRPIAERKLEKVLGDRNNKENIRKDLNSTFQKTNNNSFKKQNTLDHSFTSSHSQNLKLAQTIDHIQQRQDLYQKHRSEEFTDHKTNLQKLEQDIEKCMENSCKAVEKILHQLQEFHGTVINFHEGSKSSLSSKERQGFEEFKRITVEPSFEYTRNAVVSPIISRTKSQISILEQKIQNVKGLQKEQQRQRSVSMIHLVDLSNQSLEEIQTQIEILCSKTQTKLFTLEDSLQTLQHELITSLKFNSESRQREDKLIEQLIEKIIYKMTYL